MFRYEIGYWHTFNVDIIKAWSKKQAKKKAIEILKTQDFYNDPVAEKIEKGESVAIHSGSKEVIATKWEDFIDYVYKENLIDIFCNIFNIDR